MEEPVTICTEPSVILNVMRTVFSCTSRISSSEKEYLRPRSAAIAKALGRRSSSSRIPKTPATSARSVPWPI